MQRTRPTCQNLEKASKTSLRQKMQKTGTVPIQIVKSYKYRRCVGACFWVDFSMIMR